MKIEHIREFLMLAETENFWETSERLYIGQSTLSKHIASLEEELSVSLFDRTSRKVKLSDYGKIFLPRAKKIVEEYFALKASIDIETENKRGRFTFGAIPLIPQYKITNMFYDFFENHKNSNVLIFDGDTKSLKENLRNGKCEIIFIRMSEDDEVDEDFDYLPYCEDVLVAMLPLNHPLSVKNEIKLEELKDEDFLMIAEEPDLRKLTIKACNLIGFNPRITLDCKRLAVLLDMITLGRGVSVVPNGYLNLSDKPTLPPEPPFRIIKLNPEIKTRMCFCYKKDKKLSKMAKEFLKLAEKHISKEK